MIYHEIVHFCAHLVHIILACGCVCAVSYTSASAITALSTHPCTRMRSMMARMSEMGTSWCQFLLDLRSPLETLTTSVFAQSMHGRVHGWYLPTAKSVVLRFAEGQNSSVIPSVDFHHCFWAERFKHILSQFAQNFDLVFFCREQARRKM
jgi:hypothetical protein